MKRGLLGFPLLIFIIQVVSAQFGGYGSFSITGFFESIDSQSMTLGLLFFIFFALIFYALSKVFKDKYGEPNKAVAGTISLAISLLIVYGIYRSGFNLEDLLYIPSGFIAIILLVFAILVIWALGRKKEYGRRIFSLRKGIGGFFILLGLLIVLLANLTDIFYEKLTATIIGIFLFLLGLLLSRRGRRVMGSVGRGTWKVGRGIGKGVAATGKGAWKAGKWVGSKYDWEKEKKQAKAIGKGAAWTGKTAWKGAKAVDKFAQKKWQQKEEARKREEFRRAEIAAHKENERRNEEMRRKQQAQQQIQQINSEIARLQQMIPSASVMERGKIEDQIRAYEKQARKLEKFL